MGKLKRTIKEQEFIRAYIDCKGNAKKAYLQVFPHIKPDSAKVLGCKLLTKVNLPITELLDRIGVDDHVLSEKLQEGLDSPNKYIVARYLDMAFKLKAKYPIDETRFKLPGGDSATSVILRELIYTNKGKESKEDNNKGKGKEEVNRIKTIIEEKAPF